MNPALPPPRRLAPRRLMAYDLQADFDQQARPGDVESVVQPKLNDLYS